MADDTDRAERALDALLRAAIEDDAKPVSRSSSTLAATPFRIASFESIPTQADVHFAALLSNPVGAACRQGIWRIGQHLFETLGTTDAMREVGERVADMDPAQFGRRVTIIDHAWNGIGAGDDRWWS